MAQVAIVAKLTAAEGKADELRTVIADLVAAVDKTEPDTVIYAAAQDNDDPNVFWFYELYSDDAAGRDVHVLTPVAAKGLPA